MTDEVAAGSRSAKGCFTGCCWYPPPPLAMEYMRAARTIHFGCRGLGFLGLFMEFFEFGHGGEVACLDIAVFDGFPFCFSVGGCPVHVFAQVGICLSLRWALLQRREGDFYLISLSAGVRSLASFCRQ